jgi:hypothetical protein
MVRAAGCEMTDHNEPLLCACGQHSARFDAGKGRKKEPKWLVLSVQRAGHAARAVTSASKKEVALQHVRELCAGTHKSQQQKGAAPTDPDTSLPKPSLTMAPALLTMTL